VRRLGIMSNLKEKLTETLYIYVARGDRINAAQACLDVIMEHRESILLFGEQTAKEQRELLIPMLKEERARNEKLTQFYKDVAKLAFNEDGKFKKDGDHEDRLQIIMGKVAKLEEEL
jgi:hypothetical protein